MNRKVRDPLVMVILLLTTLASVLLLITGMSETVANTTGLAHPSIPLIHVGADGMARLVGVGSWMFVFGCLVLMLVMTFIMLGTGKHNRSRWFFISILGSLLIMLFVWWHVYDGHRSFLESGKTDYFLGFPAATAWLTYGIWLSGIPLILLYSLGFRKFIYTEQDEQKFEQLIKDQEKE